MSNLSSFIPEHLLTQIHRLPWLSGSPKYERLTVEESDGLTVEEPDGLNDRQPAKFTYKIYASIACTLLLLFLCFKATHKYIPREQIEATESRLQQANLTSLDQIVDIPKQSKALVVAARSRETIQWMEDVEPDWIRYPYILSENDNPNSTLSVPANNGNEAMRYLTFIIDNYDFLPDFIAFRHGHGSAWHQRFDSAIEINNLNLTTVRMRGYQNFNCEGSWGCDEHINLAEKQRKENAANSQAKRLLSARSFPEVDAAIYENWDTWFGVPMPEDLTGPCCAQFAVTKEAVYRRTKEKYVEWRQWLLVNPLTAFHAGVVFERLWHVIFGMPAVLCQEDQQCWCSTFNDPLTESCAT